MDQEKEVWIATLEMRNKALETKIQRLQKSKLDKMATAAMAGFCANSYFLKGINGHKEVKHAAITIAECAVNHAKALLAELEMEGE